MNHDEEGARLTRLEENRARIAQHRAEVDGSPAPHGSQWIEWKGGECPVAGDVFVQYTLRDGQTFTDPAASLDWKHTPDVMPDADILRYRVAAPLETGAINPDNSPDILSGSPETATPRCDFEFPDDAYLQGDDVLKFARTLERECADLRGKLEEAQDLLESAHDSRDLYRKRAEAAEAKLSTARQDALDAERYRWLRNTAQVTIGPVSKDRYLSVHSFEEPPRINYYQGSVCGHLDAAIDAALKEASNG